MTAPLDLAAIVKQKHRQRRPDNTVCTSDGQPWPCEAVRLVAALEAAQADNERLREAHPGEPHEFRTTCQRCGEAGYLHVALITDGEVVRIEDRAVIEAKP